MGKYLVLSLSFGNVCTSGDLDKNFCKIINEGLAEFISEYPSILGDVKLDKKDYVISFMRVMKAVRRRKHEIYLIIDEFDSFANELLFYIDNSTPDLGYAEYNRAGGAAAASAILSDFGRQLKDESVIGRIFITGLSPIAVYPGLLYSLMVVEVSECRELEAAVGFTADEVRRGLSLIYPTQPELVETHMNTIRTEYDGYRFHKDQANSVYNSQQVIYYLNALYRTGEPPQYMMDINIGHTDSIISRFIVHNYYKHKPIHDKLQFLIGNYNSTLTNHRQYVRAASLFDPTTIAGSIVRLAYYHSYLTYADPAVGAGLYVVPNAVYKDVIYDVLYHSISNDKTIITAIERIKLIRWGRADPDPHHVSTEVTALLTLASAADGGKTRHANKEFCTGVAAVAGEVAALFKRLVECISMYIMRVIRLLRVIFKGVARDA